MTSPLVDLFGELERIEFDPERLSDPSYVELQLARRQEIFDRLQSLDAAHLDVATRASLLQRIQALRERDQKLAVSLELHRNELAERLASLVQGRSASRGYRTIESQSEPPKGGRIA